MIVIAKKILTSLLLLVLVISPLANASVGHLVSMNHKVLDATPSAYEHSNNTITDHCEIQQTVQVEASYCDDCSATSCDFSHCTASIAVVLPASHIPNLRFINFKYLSFSPITFIQSTQSSLYRPPRV